MGSRLFWEVQARRFRAEAYHGRQIMSFPFCFDGRGGKGRDFRRGIDDVNIVENRDEGRESVHQGLVRIVPTLRNEL